MLTDTGQSRGCHASTFGANGPSEPLVRYHELGILLPKLSKMGIEVQVVTSTVRPIPSEWRTIKKLHLVVSVDGLSTEHDKRRSPATYERILKHIAGHRLTVHCTSVSKIFDVSEKLGERYRQRVS
jgi:hypothetical protein